MKKTFIVSILLIIVAITIVNCRTTCPPSYFRSRLLNSDTTNQITEIKYMNGYKYSITIDTVLQATVRIKKMEE